MDRLETRVVALTITIVLLSVFDAIFTLLQLEKGAVEMNPFMYLALLEGVSVFLWAKTWLTGFGVAFLAVHQNFRVAMVALHAIAFMYCVLLVYHGYLFLTLFQTVPA